jgi:hypothetical protein
MGSSGTQTAALTFGGITGPAFQTATEAWTGYATKTITAS